MNDPEVCSDINKALLVLKRACIWWEYEKYANFLYFIQNVAILSSRFFKLDFDSSLSDIFLKFIFVLETVMKFFYFDEATDKFEQPNKSVGVYDSNFIRALDLEYIRFMKVYRDQYRLMFVQYCYIQANVDQKYAIERFLIATAALDVIHWFMTLICNFTRLINCQKSEIIKVYELDLDYIESNDPIAPINDESIDFKLPERSGLKCKIENCTLEYTLGKLRKSLFVLAQLPIDFCCRGISVDPERADPANKKKNSADYLSKVTQRQMNAI